MKIFIVANDNIDIVNYANAIVSLNDDLNICRSFTSISDLPGIIGKHMFFLDAEDVVIAFRNNALLFIDYKDDKITGMTLDDYDASDIIPLSIEHFNMVIDKHISEGDILIIWIASKQYASQQAKQQDIVESRYLQERVDSFEIPMMYFMDEPTEEIAKIALEYMYGDCELRQKLVEENS